MLQPPPWSSGSAFQRSLCAAGRRGARRVITSPRSSTAAAPSSSIARTRYAYLHIEQQPWSDRGLGACGEPVSDFAY